MSKKKKIDYANICGGFESLIDRISFPNTILLPKLIPETDDQLISIYRKQVINAYMTLKRYFDIPDKITEWFVKEFEKFEKQLKEKNNELISNDRSCKRHKQRK